MNQQYPYIAVVGNGYDTWEVYEMHRHVLRGSSHKFESRTIKLFTVAKEMKLHAKQYAAGKTYKAEISRSEAYAIAKGRSGRYKNALVRSIATKSTTQ